MDEKLRARNRFGLGPDIADDRAWTDPRDWLKSQLRAEAARMERADLPSLSEAFEAAGRLRQAQEEGDMEAARQARRGMFRLLGQEVTASLERRLTTPAPYVERLVAFWSNHLCVSVAAKQAVAPLAGLYEREVIRPHVLGDYAEMVLASARHPAMLIYLDNFQSIGPDSRAARWVARRRDVERGLNENYARELLELHTLGVDGGYGQQDVEELARILTGWTLGGVGPLAQADEEPGFLFRPAFHEPGAKQLLGQRYRESGAREGERAIRDLCAHPATARHVATKLIRHFVADDPPPSAVEQTADVFLESGGNLLRVAEALVDLEEAWAKAHRKFRTPQDWLVAAFRALGARRMPAQAGPVLARLRQPLWSPPSPKGYDDRLDAWADPDSLMNRAELAHTVAEKADAGLRDPERLLDTMDLTENDPLRELIRDPALTRDERAALAFGGPAFQWR